MMDKKFTSTKEKIDRVLQETSCLFSGTSGYHLPSLRKAPAMASVIFEARKALQMGFTPERLDKGSTEIFRLYDTKGEPLAVFKASGGDCSGTYKEVCAYHLDYQGFAKVPPSVVAYFEHPLFGGMRKGLCQLHMGEEKPPGQNREFSVSSVRRIASLDIRLLNADRHISNLLVVNGHLVPIDHTLILASSFRALHVYFGWLKWEEARTPFSREEKEYILALDVVRDRKMLIEELKIAIGSADLYCMATLYLQLAVRHDLTPFEIGSQMVKVMEEKEKKLQPSIFETALRKIDSKQANVNQAMQEVVDHALSQRKKS